jgi:glycosyltransferase involved in cell wall biosynthesis
MKIAVFDLPASDSGALAILEDFYAYVLKTKPEGIEWTFIVSTDALGAPPAGSHVHVLRFPKVKLGWRRRVRFELHDAARVARDCGADAILSLQNVAVLGTRLPQVVYVHQSLPYVGKRFSYFKRDERFLALYADIFRPLIGRSVRKASAVVVQTTWFKEAIARRHRVDPDKIAVIPPSVRLDIPSGKIEPNPSLFFYPATPYVYKNIDLIVEAVAILRSEGLAPTVLITIRGDENGYAGRLHGRVEASGLSNSVRFIGRLPREEALAKYREATLLFPSRLESFGLPLLEARMAGGKIIASDTPFAREILADYPAASFHGQTDAAGLAREMRKAMEGFPGSGKAASGGKVEHEAEWGKVVALLVESVKGR